MGCGLSSLSSSHPPAAKDERRPSSQVVGAAEAAHNGAPTVSQNKYQNFHPFARLPYELRRQVWIELISQETPRAYSLELDVSLAYERDENGLHLRPAAVDFAPPRSLRGAEETRDLITATSASRIIGSTCREARDALAFVLPDKFRINANPQPWPKTTQHPHISIGYFRFNAKRDIVTILFSSPRELRYILEWSSVGNTLESFRTIQHLAIDTFYMEKIRLTATGNDCYCGKLGCSICSVDPLPRFLTLFPHLRSFHVAQVSPMFFVDERSLEEVVEPVKPCNCHGTGQSTKHDWTVFKGMAHGVWYISYTEHSECPLPTLPQLALDRVPFESKWPCYDSLSNLDMRILRQLTFPDVQYRLRRSRLS